MVLVDLETNWNPSVSRVLRLGLWLPLAKVEIWTVLQNCPILARCPRPPRGDYWCRRNPTALTTFVPTANSPLYCVNAIVSQQNHVILQCNVARDMFTPKIRSGRRRNEGGFLWRIAILANWRLVECLAEENNAMVGAAPSGHFHTAAAADADADGEEEEEIIFTDPAKNVPFWIFIGKIQSWEICSRNEMSWYCSYFSLFPSLTGWEENKLCRAFSFVPVNFTRRHKTEANTNFPNRFPQSFSLNWFINFAGKRRKNRPLGLNFCLHSVWCIYVWNAVIVCEDQSSGQGFLSL